MATSKKFHTLVEVQQKGGKIFEVLGDPTEVPSWFHSQYLKCPRVVYLEAWLVEAMFGPDGEKIPHVECVTHTVLHVNWWNPESDAKILIFGRPNFQLDVFEMIRHLANYFRLRRGVLSSKKAAAQMAETQETGAKEAETQETGIQRSPDEIPEAGTQLSPDLKVPEAGTRQPTEVAQDLVTRL
ncbi:KH domain-containing protein 3 [Marmota flaviventris]|uniref:KH domain-containing protein 3 n=1 Tax=Marmota flaviventris TaxID=93162 RepID=UPI000FFF7274|nr:KHDC3-like protein [Marmota flaviventris]